MSVSAILEAVAVGLDAIDKSTHDPALLAAVKAASVTVRLIANIAEKRTPEEAIAILERVRDHGVGPIGSDELDEQLRSAIRGAIGD